jgi:alpha-tubulin suppressor-like RCC1 family protein
MANRVRDLEAAALSEEEIIEELTILAHESGFLLSNMISEDDQISGTTILEAVKNHCEPNFECANDRNGRFHERVRRRRSRQGSHMRSMRSSMRDTGYYPWENQEGAHEFVKGLDQKLVLSTWGMMYCGGSNQIECTLRDISKTYNISLHPESFAW